MDFLRRDYKYFCFLLLFYVNYFILTKDYLEFEDNFFLSKILKIENAIGGMSFFVYF